MKKGIKYLLLCFCCMTLLSGSIKVNAASPVSLEKKSITLKITGVNEDIKYGKTKLKVKKSKGIKVKKVTYKSANPEIATVTKKGVVKAKSAGTTKITTTIKYQKKVNGKWKTCTGRTKCKVKVINKHKYKMINPTDITLDQTEMILPLKTTKPIKATLYPANVTEHYIKWYTSNPDVAIVDYYGNVRAEGVGEAIITAEIGNGKKATCKVTVMSYFIETEITVYK